jgi:hypothetical protein
MVPLLSTSITFATVKDFCYSIKAASAHLDEYTVSRRKPANISVESVWRRKFKEALQTMPQVHP